VVPGRARVPFTRITRLMSAPRGEVCRDVVSTLPRASDGTPGSRFRLTIGVPELLAKVPAHVTLATGVSRAR
jgi:hypothetical protein